MAPRPLNDCVRDVDAPRRGLGMPEHRDVRVGRRLETRQSAADDEQAEDEEAELPLARGHRRTEVEEQGTDAIEQESSEHTGAIAPARDDTAGRQSHQEVTAVDRSLHPRGVSLGHLERLLKMLVEHIKYVVRKAPEEE